MKITAVVLHYYKERTDNIKIIVEALQKGSRKPDKIIAFHPNIQKSKGTKDMINKAKKMGITVILEE